MPTAKNNHVYTGDWYNHVEHAHSNGGKQRSLTMWDNENPFILQVSTTECATSEVCNIAFRQNTGGEPDGQKTSLLFDASKRELFTPNSGFKTLHRRMRSTWKIVT